MGRNADITDGTCDKPLVIFSAGGKGTRIQSLNASVPKPMIPIAGKPVLQWGIENLAEQGFHRFIITVSHLAEKITEYFKDGADFGCSIEYYYEAEPLGNAGALYKLWESGRLEDNFFYLMADAVFSVDWDRFYRFHLMKGALASLFVHPNSHPYDSGIVISDPQTGIVTDWLNKEDERPEWYKNSVNAGLQILSTELLRVSGIHTSAAGSKEGRKKIDLDRDVLKPLINTRRIMAYTSSEYCKDAGTPERFHAVEKDIENGVTWARNLKNPQKAIFAGWNSIVAQYAETLRVSDEFELLPGAGEAVHRINESGYLAIAVTNKPDTDSGETEDGMLRNKMETLLGHLEAYFDVVYDCPQHPVSGFEGETSVMQEVHDYCRIQSEMLAKAGRDFNVDLCHSWFIGSSRRSVVCGKNAGCRTVYINSGKRGSRSGAEADYTAASLFEAVKLILDDVNEIPLISEKNR